MQSTTFTTPSGHKITIKPFVTFGDKRQLSRALMDTTDIDPNKPGDMRVKGKAMLDVQDLAVSLLIEQVELKDGTVHLGSGNQAIVDVIMAMPEEDGQMIYDKIDKLSTDSLTLQKKGA